MEWTSGLAWLFVGRGEAPRCRSLPYIDFRLLEDKRLINSTGIRP